MVQILKFTKTVSPRRGNFGEQRGLPAVPRNFTFWVDDKKVFGANLGPSLRQCPRACTICVEMVNLRTEFLLHHNHLGIRALAYPDGVKGIQPPLNVCNCVCQKYCPSSCVHYIINFVRENVKNCTSTLISHFASEFSSFCFVPRPLARSPFKNSWSITYELPPL